MWRSASATIRSRACSAVFAASDRNGVSAEMPELSPHYRGRRQQPLPSSFCFCLVCRLSGPWLRTVHACATDGSAASVWGAVSPLPPLCLLFSLSCPDQLSNCYCGGRGAKILFAPTLYRIIPIAVYVPISSFSLGLLRYLFRPASQRAAIRPRQYEPGRDRILPAAATNDQLLPETIS